MLRRAACRSRRPAVSSGLWSPRGSSGGILHSILEIELLHIPQDVGFQNGGMEIADAILRTCKNVRTRQKYHWLIFSENLLRTVIEFLPLFEGTRGHLFLVQAVDFRFPRSGGVGLRRVPQMCSAAGQPHIDVGIRVGISAGHG